ncbi:MAG TPA: hypothetical protein VNV65_04130 [Candidatus Solibacter sp.]|jgi:hypothetical protein|nr:hypothetical protein [Candidatus Solibacter sp.]
MAKEMTDAALANPRQQAVRCTVPDRARDLVDAGDFDYSDAFAIRISPDEGRSAEAWAKAMLSPRNTAQLAFAGAWTAVMGVQRPPAGRRLAVFRLASPDRGAAVLAADSARYRIRLVILANAGWLTFATFVKGRRALWRQLLTPILVGHRRVAPLLLELAVKGGSEQR